ncbi:hypothetical protein FIL92_01170 [SAR202 cluster bacterium AD-812-D07_MRT_10900m]|nr:hypothetical protein [SAR202 cluster bacterium AD-812-D07_MRT_10900m]
MGILWWIIREAITEKFRRKPEQTVPEFPLWLVREEIAEAELASNARKSMYPVAESLEIGGLVFDASVYLHHHYQDRPQVTASLGIKKMLSSVPSKLWETGDFRLQECTISRLFVEPMKSLLDNSKMELLSKTNLDTVIGAAWALGATYVNSDRVFVLIYDHDMEAQRPERIMTKSGSLISLRNTIHRGLLAKDRIIQYRFFASRRASLKNLNTLAVELDPNV